MTTEGGHPASVGWLPAVFKHSIHTHEKETNMSSRGWDWHAWHKDPVTNVKKYMGFFENESSAMHFKRSQDNPNEFMITNFGPTDFRTPAKKTPPPTRRPSTVRVPETREQMQARDKQRKAREAAQVAARAEADRKNRENREANRLKREAEKKRKEQNDREMAGIRKEAAAGLKKHKADEAADLKAGVNR